jgi:hypothetical protein
VLQRSTRDDADDRIADEAMTRFSADARFLCRERDRRFVEFVGDEATGG